MENAFEKHLYPSIIVKTISTRNTLALMYAFSFFLQHK